VFWLAERNAAAPDQLLDAFNGYREIFEQLLDRPQCEASTSSPPVDSHQRQRVPDGSTSR
jgi:hypothetical protein